MSWIDKIKTALVIKTGDGKEYRPQWLNASKAIDYNVAEFEFPNISGTLVYRGTPKGTKYNLEIYFQGENHLDLSLAFEKSASDPRAWNVTHPFYGLITVQPTALNFDNTGYNVSKITGTIMETITDQYPKGTTVPVDKITADTETCNETQAQSFAANAKPTASDATKAQSNNSIVYTNAAKFASPGMAQDYFNAFNTAQADIANLVSAPLAAIRSAQNVIRMPARFTENVTTRMAVLGDAFNTLRGSLGGTTVKSQKQLYENNAGTTVSAMALTAATPQTGDYNTKNDVLNTIELLLGYYNQYLADLDALQTATGGTPDSYIPDAEPLQQLNLLVNYTLSNLFSIALDAKQERSILLEENSNWIILAHRFYGLVDDDSTIENLIAQNNAGLSEMLQIRKGRKITYYV